MKRIKRFTTTKVSVDRSPYKKMYADEAVMEWICTTEGMDMVIDSFQVVGTGEDYEITIMYHDYNDPDEINIDDLKKGLHTITSSMKANEKFIPADPKGTNYNPNEKHLKAENKQ